MNDKMQQYINSLADPRAVLTLTRIFDKLASVESVAAAGTSQATAAAATKARVVVTGADSTAGVRLVEPDGDEAVLVINPHASNTVKVYPAVGGAINALSTNAAYTLAAASQRLFVATSTTQWYV